MTADPERTALKEWAVLVQAMARGDIAVLVRKGGIRERRAGFAVRHDRFLLYPTWFHERADELAPRFRGSLPAVHAARAPEGTIHIAHLAHVAAVWRATSLEPLRAIAGEHGLAWHAVESRFHYRGVPELFVVAVRVARLPHAVALPEIRRYGGCVSWVKLDQDVDVARATPVVDDDAFVRRIDALASALGAPVERGESPVT